MNKNHQCGSCLHLTREKAFEAPCANLGKLPISKACGTFKPDLYAVAHPERQFDDLELLSSALAKMSLSQLSVLSALADRERVTRKYGYKFFQRVYVRYMGPASNNYLSNFMSARILDVDAHNIRLIGDSDYRAYIVLQHTKGRTSSLYRAAEFDVLRADMIANKKFVDPSLRKTSPIANASARGVIANVDDFVPDSVELRNARVKKQRADDLVSMVSKMHSGMYGTRDSRQSREIEVNWS